jgi:hypothetical protein
MARLQRIELTDMAHAPGCDGSRQRASADELRCDCGSLLARWTPEGLELKCRRCKRRIIVPVEGSPHRPPPAT